MKKLFILLTVMVTVGCSKETINLPDHKQQIDANSAEIQLLKAKDALHDLQINNLEVRVDSLEIRLTNAEDMIVINSDNISVLFDQVDNLDQELSDLRNRFRIAIRNLKRADRQLRRQLYSEVNSLRRSLNREIRNRRLADNNLQNQIDNLESDLNSFESRQNVINRFLTRGLFFTNLRISQLNSQIQNALNNINSRLTTIENDIDNINSEITSIQSQMSDMQSQLNDVESKSVSVVYPCGEGDSEEILLQTQDGLVAYQQQMRTVNATIQVQEIVPAYSYCNHPWKTLSNCPSGLVVNVPANVNNTGDVVNLSHQVLVKAYLDVLGNGNYQTTDGYSCNFTIANGEVQ